jgi:hypothetical protein
VKHEQDYMNLYVNASTRAQIRQWSGRLVVFPGLRTTTAGLGYFFKRVFDVRRDVTFKRKFIFKIIVTLSCMSKCSLNKHEFWPSSHSSISTFYLVLVSGIGVCQQLKHWFTGRARDHCALPSLQKLKKEL